MQFSPCWALPEYIWSLTHVTCLRVFQWCHGSLFNDCIMWDDKDKVIGFGFKRSRWIHLGWLSTRSPELQLFQLPWHSHVTNCWLISFSADFPWNMTIKYKMQLFEGSWDKILHSKMRTQCFWKEEIFFSGSLSLEVIHHSPGSGFCNFFVKTSKESEQPFWNYSIGQKWRYWPTPLSSH